MKITFIRPNMNARKASDALQPLVFALLAGLTPPDIETTLYDDRIEDIPFDEPTDLVAMTVETFSAKRAYDIAARYRKRGVPVVMGGFHPTLVPKEAAQHATTIVVGDAESIWPQLIADFQQGRLQPTYRATALPSSLNIFFDRRMFEGKSYPPLSLVQWGRGCPHQCEFCSIHAMYDTYQYQRPIDDVITEVEALDSQWLFFVDDNLFAYTKQFTRLLEALKPLHLHWSCQISLEVSYDKTLMTLLEQSGCQAVLIGFESLQLSNLRQMNKLWNVSKLDYATAIKRFYDHGIMVCGTFVLGYDDDTPDSFEQCFDFALTHKLFLSNFNPLTPFPGTPLYRRLQQEGRLIRENWWLDEHYQYGQAVFHPKQMSAEELEQGCFDARRRFNTRASILQRAFHLKANMRNWRNAVFHCAANMINRKEVLRKQGAFLGEHF
ncbi:B12-binding domain-containing radical SAM protein [candidate division KSB3 bacterium]|uniref:B12-binding domain-containing radical SAM protein n=1 Tax=candidate division KSB3 bacterium TaxID=2044937 RepID=A0A2G6KEU4_9BACT|nr:MAG: B12-binding domain-containing radical SAM protein [candidate division KSB3 bacterium]